MARSLNIIHLIGNLTRNPELRYTDSGRAICLFGLATNRSWKREDGALKEETSYHRIIAWEKLAEQCAQLLVKGRKVYVQGRLAYRTYQKDDETREVAEVVIEDMLLLDNKPGVRPIVGDSSPTEPTTRSLGHPDGVSLGPAQPIAPSHANTVPTATKREATNVPTEHEVTSDDITDPMPF